MPAPPQAQVDLAGALEHSEAAVQLRQHLPRAIAQQLDSRAGLPR